MNNAQVLRLFVASMGHTWLGLETIPVFGIYADVFNRAAMNYCLYLYQT